jgi:probable phosphoglycerate mutase
MVTGATEHWPGSWRRRVYLMRHGEVDYFAADGRPFRPATVALNADGRAQAEAAGRLLAAVPLDRVVTSGLPRAVETATLATAGRGLTLEVRPDLREIEAGRLAAVEALDAAAVERTVLGALSADIGPDSRFLNGETFASLQARTVPCFDALLAEPGWRHLLVVAHGVVNRVLLCRLLNAGLSALGNLEQDAGCLNVLDLDETGRCLVRLVNFTPLTPLKAGLERTSLELLFLQFLRGRGEQPFPGGGVGTGSTSVRQDSDRGSQ